MNWQIDSAGTSHWHAGETPDPRAIACARSFGVSIEQQRSRQVTNSDFERFDLILAMDKSNFQHLQRLAPAKTKHKIKLLLDYWDDAPLREVPDPYYNDAFEESYRLIEKACLQLLEKTQQPLSI